MTGGPARAVATRRAAPGPWLAVALAFLATTTEVGSATAQRGVKVSSNVAAGSLYSIHAEVRPATLRLGERATYVGWIVVPHGQPVSWIVPGDQGAFHWEKPVSIRAQGTAGAADTARIEIPLQVFALGRVSVPGIHLRLAARSGPAGEHVLPMASLWVAPQIALDDTSAQLRPVRGPLPAPWWERVPWPLVLGIVALLIAILALIRWLRRRRPPVAAPVVAVAPSRRDPAAEALAELAALRRLQLPEHGRFGEHAFHLTRIVRRYLEATAGGVRPGLTTSELISWLTGSASPVDVARLEGLLRLWDFIKFARGSSTVEEAHRAEDAVGALLRPPQPPPQREVA